MQRLTKKNADLSAALAALLAVLAAPAFADDAHLNGMAEDVVASEWSEPTKLDGYLFNPLDFEEAGTGYLLDATPLADVQSTFGGTAQTEDIFEGTPFTWLCYDTGTARTTFIAVRTQGDDNETVPPGPVLGVIVEEASAPANPACTANSAASAPEPSNDIPTLGATTADLAARFGSAPVDAGGHLAYVTEYLQGDEESWTERKVIYYRLENGIVTGIAYRLDTIR
jgi:hypothetical protein